ncbi:oligosaccharide flippase family protein [Devosia sp. A8/3-2]|nr:oligosaccharide flippase family protein [Devosia sp. A8/3-2]
MSLWSMLGNAANNLIGFAVFAVIVRLVDPTAIGVLAFAVVFVDMGKIFVSAGVPDLIVRQKEWSDDYATMCFWLNMFVGALSAPVVVFIVGPLADANFAAGTTPILAVSASCFLIDAARVVPESGYAGSSTIVPRRGGALSPMFYPVFWVSAWP